jgi:ribosome maturation factor RimP
MPAASESRRHLLQVLTPVVSGLQLDLEDVNVSVVGRRSVVRVIVDGDPGVDLDAVADVSRAVSEALDADAGDGFAGPYVLEVSSPGVDRPLTEPRHWRRAAGRLVTAPVDGLPITGRVLSADGNGIAFEIDGATRIVPWSSLGAGKVQVEFNRPGPTTQADVESDDETDDETDETEAGDE